MYCTRVNLPMNEWMSLLGCSANTEHSAPSNSSWKERKSREASQRHPSYSLHAAHLVGCHGLGGWHGNTKLPVSLAVQLVGPHEAGAAGLRGVQENHVRWHPLILQTIVSEQQPAVPRNHAFLGESL